MTVEDGKFITILGPSGCGKSTLLHIVAGLLPPTDGRVVFEGISEGTPPTSVVFQEHALFPWRTVRQNVAFGPEGRGVPAREREARARHLPALVGLQAFADRFPHQRLGIGP